MTLTIEEIVAQLVARKALLEQERQQAALHLNAIVGGMAELDVAIETFTARGVGDGSSSEPAPEAS